MRVRIERFQSIESAEIVVEGFTAVTGRTNLGKSALLRAIAAARFGLPGDHYVRNGANSCRVAISSGGRELEWCKARRKRDGEETYLEVDGHRHTRFGRDHLSITGPLGFAQIGDLRPQVALQHDPIFLLTETPNAVAEVFRMLGRADVVASAQAAAKSDLKSAGQTLKVRSGDRERAEAAAADLGWVDALEADVAGWRRLFDCDLAPGIAFRQKAQALAAECRHLAPRQVPEGRDAGKAATAANLAIEALGAAGEARRLAPAEVPDVLPADSAACAAYERVVVLDAVRRARALSPAEVPEPPRAPAEPPVAALARVGALRRALVEESEAALAVQGLDDALAARERERAGLEAELGACPTCDRPFEAGG